ncbi:MAG: hypothetical protein ACR2NN_20725 [Bryobacteraceae bacterium]
MLAKREGKTLPALIEEKLSTLGA